STLSPLPIGTSSNEQGTTDHRLTAAGPALGAAFFFHRGSSLRWTVRLGGGLWLAAVNDRRSGTFTTSISVRPDGTKGPATAYALDPVAQSADARYLYVAPEARVGIPIGKHAEIAFGIEGFVALAFSQPTWAPFDSRVPTGTCRTATAG